MGQIDENSIFWNKHKNEVDTSFLAYDRSMDQKLQENGGHAGGLIMTMGVLGIIAMVAIGINGLEN